MNYLISNVLLYIPSIPTDIPEQPLQMIEKYGLSMVLIVVLFIVLLFLGRFFINQFKEKNRIITLKDKQLEKKNDEIVKLTKEILIATKNVEEYMVDNNHKLTKKDLDVNSKNTLKVYQILNHIKGKYDFDRVNLYQFHNGGKNINGVDFKKCSTTHEVCDLGINSIKDIHQNRHISSEYLWSQVVSEGHGLYFDDIEKLEDKPNNMFYLNLKPNNIKSYYSILVKDYNEKPIGFVTLVTAKNIISLEDEDVKNIKEKLISIGSFIDANEN